MFRRLLLADSVDDLTLVVFLLFFVAFIATVIWAVRLPRQRIQHLEELPLESDPEFSSTHARQD